MSSDPDDLEEEAREAARGMMRGLMGNLMGLDYDTFRATYPGGPEAYDRRVRGTSTPADIAAWDAWAAAEAAKVAAQKVRRKAARQGKRAQGREGAS